MCHAIRRLNKLTPFTVFNQYRDRAYERDLNGWTLIRLAQDKFFIVMNKILSDGTIPHNLTLDEFSCHIRDFVFTSIMAELNFNIAVKMAGPDLIHTITDAPRKVNQIFYKLDDFMKISNTQKNLDYLNDMIITDKLSIQGFKMDDENGQKLLKVKDHDNGIIKYVLEFQLKGMFNPLLSTVARNIYDDFNFEPSPDTKNILELSGTEIKIVRSSRHNNMALNFMELADHVFEKDLKKNNKLYDVIYQCIDCIIPFNTITKCPENIIGPILVDLPK